ncbi:MAG: MFS transporter [Candidatus Spechtbacterales bacterium]|nr:MFS transporter [Candidatus Spechtbacterales bacterium]
MVIHEFFHHYFPRINKELKEFYAAIAIRGLAIHMITIFEPIYIYIHFGNSLPKTFLYFGASSLIFGVFSPWALRLTKRIGIKHTMLLSVPFLFAYYVGLWNIDKLGVLILILPLFAALERLLFWPAYHIAFTRFSDKGKRGREVSLRTMLLSATAVIAPFIGGIIIQELGGFTVLFAVVLALLFAAVIPLFMTKEVYEGDHETVKMVFRELKSKKYRRKVLGLGSLASDLALHAFVWPVFLFILAINFETLGAITSATLFLGMIFTFYVGRKSDDSGSEKVLSVGAFLNAVIWPFKIFVNSPLTAFLADALHRFGRTSSHISVGTIIYEWAGENAANRDRFIIIREAALNIARGLILFLFALLSVFSFPLAWMFALGPIFALGQLFVIDKPRRLLKETSKEFAKED